MCHAMTDRPISRARVIFLSFLLSCTRGRVISHNPCLASATQRNSIPVDLTVFPTQVQRDGSLRVRLGGSSVLEGMKRQAMQ